MWNHIKALALTVAIIGGVGSLAVTAPGGFLAALMCIAVAMILATTYIGCLAAVKGEFNNDDTE